MASISTYTSYLSVNRDINSTLSKVASQSSVERETAYYKEKIGEITTVDEFLGDYRLYSYAMKAYGLGDMTYGKAFMRKVLESDLTDSSSFANSLTDKRYLQFAEAFNFQGDKKTVQNDSQSTSLTDAYRASFTEEETALKAENTYFAAQIGKVTSADGLINNTRLRTYVLEAVGLESDNVSKTYLKQVLTSDLDDPESVANKAKNPAWKKLAEAFNFKADGTIDASIQTTDQTEDLKLDYIYNQSTFPSTLLHDANTRYWEKNIATVTTAKDLVADSRMLEYVKKTFSLSSTIMPSTVASLMSSENAAAAYGNTKLLDAFNFETDGTLASGNTAQTSAQTTVMVKDYKTAFNKDKTATIDDAVKNYDTRIDTFTNLEDFFVSNKKDKDKKNDAVTEVWDVALRAYGIDPDEISQSELKRVLTSDVTDKKSYVNSLKDERFVELNKAFNFSADGELRAPVLAQSESVTDRYASDYESIKLRTLTGAEKEAAGKKADTEIEYYKSKMQSVETVKEFLADKRLTNFILEANGIDPESVTSDDLKKMFSSDLDDPNSFVNTHENKKFAEIVASFNFDAEGNITKDAIQGGQQRGAVLGTVNQYVRQTLEEQQGESNQGVRLAMYFERMAPTISSAYGFLSDDALFEFFKTAFSVPSSIANMDVTKQAELVTKYIDITQLQDPEYVEKIVKRYTALYDVQSGSQSPVLSILSGSTSISADTLLAVSQLRSQ